jgi:hypothetical protein
MMGELKFFLGFQIKQLKEGTFLCQTKYVKDMLKRFDMVDSKPIKTPMALNGHLDLNEEGKLVDQKVFRSMIGSLLYICASRTDIMLSVCMCARFQANTKECHHPTMHVVLLASVTFLRCLHIALGANTGIVPQFSAIESTTWVNRSIIPIDVKSAPHAKYTASRTKLA